MSNDRNDREEGHSFGESSADSANIELYHPITKEITQATINQCIG